jgi:AraC-like DNA-binding protein
MLGGNMKEIVLPEIVAVGVYQARLGGREREMTRSRKTTMFELELPLGSGGVSYIDKESRPITEDLLICAKPGQLRHTRLPFHCYYVHMILHEGELCERLLELPSYILLKDRAPYEAIFEQLCALYGTALDLDRIRVQSLVLELVYRLCLQAEQVSYRGLPSNRAAIERVIRYIKEHPTADLSLRTMAEYASFSPIHFHNCFKRSTGRSLREFVEEERIRRAVNLLVSTDLTLSQIAYECGFSSQSYFSYAFKKRMKLPPREYVREIKRKYESS